MSLRAWIGPSRRVPLLLAGCAAVVAAAALSAAPQLSRAPAPAVAAAAPPARPSPGAGAQETRSYAYYPEQLAALSSLNSFQPAADSGITAVTPAPRRSERTAEPPRRADTARSFPLAAPAPTRPEAAPKPAAEPAQKPEGWKLFGVALPRPGWPDGEALGKQAAGWRDGLSEKAVALGAGVGRMWPFGRTPRPDATPLATPPAPNSPPRGN
jgi:hypothetical protein